MQLTLTQPSLDRSILWGASKPSLLRNVFLITLGSLALAISAQFYVPIQPVPVTLESLVVLFIGMTYGFRLGITTVLVYVVAGVAQLPFFAIPHAGITGGYLLGYILAAGLTGFLTERGWGRHMLSTFMAAVLGSLLILVCGWIVLSQLMSAAAAFNVGIKPFFLSDILKIIFVALVTPNFWRSVPK